MTSRDSKLQPLVGILKNTGWQPVFFRITFFKKRLGEIFSQNVAKGKKQHHWLPEHLKCASINP